MSEHNANVSFESNVNVVVHRANGYVIPLGDITEGAAPENPLKRFVWVLNIKAKLKFPWLYGFKKGS